MFASLLTTNAMLGITEEAFRWTTERLPRARYVASSKSCSIGACSRRESSTRTSPESSRRLAAMCGRACFTER